MAHLLAQHIFQDIDGLAGDRYINTFHFTCADPQASNAYNGVASAVNRFYTVGSGGGTSPIINATAGHALAPGSGTKVYDMSDAMPRLPRSFVPHTGISVPATETYPAEVAVCLSFAAAPQSGVKPQSLKGRIYLGPFNIDAGENVPDGAWSRPALNLRTEAVAMFMRIQTEVATYDAQLCVYSRVLDELYPVTHAWCDDAWDTQRRRGGPPTSRAVSA